MFKTDYQKFHSRIALWHEAGHAAVAHYLGLKVVSIGTAPYPHCLVDHAGVSDDDIGLLLCAGAAATAHVFGFEWGYHNDYEIAQEIGDLETYRDRAYQWVREHISEIQHIVDTLDPEGREDDEPLYPQLGPADPVAISIETLLDEVKPSDKLVKAISVAAGLQTKFPKTAAFFAKLGAKRRKAA